MARGFCEPKQASIEPREDGTHPWLLNVEQAFLLHGWSPAVLVSDIEMPNEDGYAFMRRVTTARGTRPVAIAVMAYARPDDRLRALNAGFDWHLGKRVDPGELVAAIATLCGKSLPAAERTNLEQT